MNSRFRGVPIPRGNVITALALVLCLAVMPNHSAASNPESFHTGPVMTFGLGYAKSLMEDHPKGSYCVHLSLSRSIGKDFALGIESGFFALGQQRIGYIEDDIGDMRVYERRDLIPLTFEIYRMAHFQKVGTVKVALGFGGYFLGRAVMFRNSEPDMGVAWPNENCFGGNLGVDLYLGKLSQEVDFGSGIRLHWLSMRDGTMPVVTLFAELHWK